MPVPFHTKKADKTTLNNIGSLLFYFYINQHDSNYG